mmetsp:Transcript_1268/g.4334  ORF Transcript_1268/g.4334 Transcript_1268/m.4334 type:complete len:225 (+) Transcript_1268:9288-9962(+)
MHCFALCARCERSQEPILFHVPLTFWNTQVVRVEGRINFSSLPHPREQCSKHGGGMSAARRLTSKKESVIHTLRHCIVITSSCSTCNIGVCPHCIRIGFPSCQGNALRVWNTVSVNLAQSLHDELHNTLWILHYVRLMLQRSVTSHQARENSTASCRFHVPHQVPFAVVLHVLNHSQIILALPKGLLEVENNLVQKTESETINALPFPKRKRWIELKAICLENT